MCRNHAGMLLCAHGVHLHLHFPGLACRLHHSHRLLLLLLLEILRRILQLGVLVWVWMWWRLLLWLLLLLLLFESFKDLLYRSTHLAQPALVLLLLFGLHRARTHVRRRSRSVDSVCHHRVRSHDRSTGHRTRRRC